MCVCVCVRSRTIPHCCMADCQSACYDDFSVMVELEVHKHTLHTLLTHTHTPSHFVCRAPSARRSTACANALHRHRTAIEPNQTKPNRPERKDIPPSMSATTTTTKSTSTLPHRVGLGAFASPCMPDKEMVDSRMARQIVQQQAAKPNTEWHRPIWHRQKQQRQQQQLRSIKPGWASKLVRVVVSVCVATRSAWLAGLQMTNIPHSVPPPFRYAKRRNRRRRQSTELNGHRADDRRRRRRHRRRRH